MTLLAMRTSTEMVPTLNQALRSCQACKHLEPNAIPKFTSPVTVYQHNNGDNAMRKHRMVAKLYETSYGQHYVLFNQDKLYSASPIFLNLKHTSVQRVDDQKNLLRFFSDSCDGMSLTIGLSSEEAVQKWLNALSNNSNTCGSKSPVPIPKSPLLPTLAEDDEE